MARLVQFNSSTLLASYNNTNSKLQAISVDDCTHCDTGATPYIVYATISSELSTLVNNCYCTGYVGPESWQYEYDKPYFDWASMVVGTHNLTYDGVISTYCQWSKEIVHVGTDKIYTYDGICTDGNPPYSCDDCNGGCDIAQYKDEWLITSTFITVRIAATGIVLYVSPNGVANTNGWWRGWALPTEGRCISAGGPDTIVEINNLLAGGTGYVEGYP